MPLAITRRSRLALLSYAAFVTTILLVPIPHAPAPAGFTGMDKAAHALLMYLMARLIEWNLASWSLRRPAAFLLTVAYAGGMEMAQGLFPPRTPEVWDVFASAMGAALALFRLTRRG